MSVLAVVSLRIKTIKDGKLEPASLDRLKQANEIIGKSGRKYHFLQAVSDPTILYMMSSWPSLEYMKVEWLPSQDHQQIFDILKEDLDTNPLSFGVYDIDTAKQPLPLPGQHGIKLLAIGHSVLPADAKHQYDTIYSQVKPAMQDYAGGPHKIADGWRVDPAEGKQEFILLSGWENADQHRGFASQRPEDFQEYLKLQPLCENMEINHVRSVEL